MKKIISIIIIALFFNASFSQSKTISLEKGNRTIKLYKEDDLTFYKQEIKSNGDSIVTIYSGLIKEFKHDTATLTSLYVQNKIFRKNKLILVNSEQSFRDTIVQASFDLNNIYKIEKYREVLDNNLAFFSITSAIVALIVSPIVSINFKNKSFNYYTYSKVTGISLSICTVSLTLSMSFSNKTIKLGNKNWKIKK